MADSMRVTSFIRMTFVDPGSLLALAQPRDALHVRARAGAQAVHESLILTEYVLWATVNALSKPVDRAKAHHLVRHVQTAGNYEIVAASSALLEAGLKLPAGRPDKE